MANCNQLLDDELDKIKRGGTPLTVDQQKDLLQKALDAKKKAKKKLEYEKEVLENVILLAEAHPYGAKAGLKSLLESDVTGETRNWNLEQDTNLKEGMWKSQLEDVYEELAGSMGGQRLTPEQIKLDGDIRSELHGFDSGNPKAKSLAQRINDVKNTVRKELDEVYQDAAEISVNRDRWLDSPDKVIANLRKNLLDPSTADDVFKAVNTKMELHEPVTNDMLVFRDAEAMLDFNTNYGQGNVLSEVDDFIKRNAQILTDAKIIGGKRNFKLALEHAKKFDEANPSPKSVTNPKTQKVMNSRTLTLEAQYRVASGEVDKMGDVSAPMLWTSAFASRVRGLTNIGLLGNVIWTSIADMGQVHFANTQMGISRTKTWGAMLGGLFSNKTERELADLGYGIEHLQTSLSNRFNEEGYGVGAVQKTSDFVMFISGIQAWSRSLKASSTKLQHVNIIHKIQDSLASGSVDKHLEWLNFSQADIEAFRGLNFDDFVNFPEKQKLMVMRAVDGRAKNAVLEPGSATRVFTTGGAQKGTVHGEAQRMFMQITSFMFESFNRNVLNDITMKKGPTNKILLRAEQTAIMIMLGVLGDELKNMAYNKTPEEGSPFKEGDAMQTASYWASKIAKYTPQSTVFEKLNLANPLASHRFDGASYGVGIDTVGKIGAAVRDDIGDLMTGKKKARYDRTWKAVNQNYNPLNIWYTRVLYNHYVRDSISSMLDPNFDKKKRKQARRLKKRTGQTDLIKLP